MSIINLISFDKASSTATEFKFIIDSIQRFDDDSEIELSWDGDNADIEDQQGSTKIVVPGKNNFKVVDIKIGNEKNK